MKKIQKATKPATTLAVETRIERVCVDLAKSTFHVVGIDRDRKTVFRKKFTRAAFLDWLTNLPEKVIVAMEACAGSQWWGQKCQELGHTPMLIPPHRVKPYALNQKNDYNDAEAIGEASRNSKTFCVPVKTSDQQDLATLLAARQGLLGERIALTNRIRAFLLERGLPAPKGVASFRNALAAILSEENVGLTLTLKTCLLSLQTHWQGIERRIFEIEQQMNSLTRQNASSPHLNSVPGIGPLTVAALLALIGDPRRFENGRAMAAYLGLVVRQNTSGDKIRLGHITKRGDVTLRTLLIHGARAALRSLELSPKGIIGDGRFRKWCEALLARKSHRNVAVVAIANKLVRILWAVWTKEVPYNPAHA